jgi:Ni,Fe-hydrogenase I cytochrome b subunit
MAQSDVYSTPHRIVHWLTAALIIGLVPVGLFIGEHSLSAQSRRQSRAEG